MIKKPPKNRGGKRPGAGRKRKFGDRNSAKVSYSIDPEIAEAIEKRAEAEKVTRSEIACRALGEWLEREMYRRR